ncbi:MAG: ATP-binding protein [Muribaculaceae bacterium]|nr:ATP-binding protein [Muribaculaceae bacterium]
MYKLPVYKKIKERLEEPRRFIQVVMGPRQVGKSTVVKQVLQDINIPYKFFAADGVPNSNFHWISDCWETVRILSESKNKEYILVIDEIQKINNWSEIVKKLWDEDSFHNRNIKVVLLGSSRILLKKGLSESLAGRFEEIRMAQWSFNEIKECFGLSLNEYLFYGGYPGAIPLISSPERYEEYISSSIIEATLNRDIINDTIINKPALLRQTFELASAYSGQILSYTKMMGQLQDAGNTTTLVQYLHLLNESCLVGGLQKFTNDIARTRGTIPKFQVYDNSFKNVYFPFSFEEAIRNPAKWGNIYESGVGAYILCQAFLHRFEVFYWRERNLEVDFILRRKSIVVALEVKSNSQKTTKGLEEFKRKFNPHRTLIIGEGGLSLEEFFSIPILSLFKDS